VKPSEKNGQTLWPARFESSELGWVIACIPVVSELIDQLTCTPRRDDVGL
jgi:hypothetical protein